MRVAARARKLTPIVHAVEDGGAVCGARPAGEWRLSSVLPVNCPSCLLELAAPRLAVCEVVEVHARSRHLRVVGERGFKPREGIETRTFCGRIPSIDLELVRVVPVDVCAGCVHSASRRARV